MKLSLTMIATGLCAVMFTACMSDTPSDSGNDATDDSAQDEAIPATEAEVTPGEWVPLVVDGQTVDGVLTTANTSADAAHSCPSGTACMYQNANFQGQGFAFGIWHNFQTLPCPACTNGSHGNDGSFNDQATSWKNNSSTRFCWYTNAEFHGSHTMNPHTQRRQLSSNLNDTASSIRACP
jgi:hypothetical protein